MMSQNTCTVCHRAQPQGRLQPYHDVPTFKDQAISHAPPQWRCVDPADCVGFHKRMIAIGRTYRGRLVTITERMANMTAIEISQELHYLNERITQRLEADLPALQEWRDEEAALMSIYEYVFGRQFCPHVAFDLSSISESKAAVACWHIKHDPGEYQAHLDILKDRAAAAMWDAAADEILAGQADPETALQQWEAVE